MNFPTQSPVHSYCPERNTTCLFVITRKFFLLILQRLLVRGQRDLLQRAMVSFVGCVCFKEQLSTLLWFDATVVRLGAEWHHMIDAADRRFLRRFGHFSWLVLRVLQGSFLELYLITVANTYALLFSQ